jgi:hypothetical protein
MAYSVAFKDMYIMCNDQIRKTGIFITSNIYHFFMLATFKIHFPSSYFDIILSITIINFCAPNVSAHNFIKHTLMDLKITDKLQHSGNGRL